MNLSSLKKIVSLLAAGVVAIQLHAAPGTGGGATVGYNPSLTNVTGIIQGTPVTFDMAVTLTNLTATASTTLIFTPQTFPVGVTAAQAATYISASPATLTFTPGSSTQRLTVTINVPTGTVAGSYVWLITTSAWSTGITPTDAGSIVNGTAQPPAPTNTSSPAVTILTPAPLSTYTISVSSTGVVTPAVIPIVARADALGSGASVINGISLLFGGQQLNLTGLVTGLLTTSATGTTSYTTSTPAPGGVTIAATATNLLGGTATGTLDVNIVISAPPPKVVINTPASGSTFTYSSSATGAQVPLGFTGTSVYGNITGLTATIDGAAVSGLTTSGVSSSLTATGSAGPVLGAGTHIYAVTATNAYGSATASTSFTVKTVVSSSNPTVTVSTPHASLTRVSGDPATVISYTFSGTTPTGTLSSMTITMNGTTITPSTITGLGTATVTGSGTFSVSAGGTFTIVATDKNSFANTATAQTAVTVTQTQPALCEDFAWNGAFSYNQTVCGGTSVPVTFTLSCHGSSVKDTTTLITVYEIHSNGAMSNPVIYKYGSDSDPSPPTFAYLKGTYTLNFPTSSGVHHYRTEIYHPLSTDGKHLQLLGAKDFYTKSCCSGDSDDDGSHSSGDCDDDGGDSGDNGSHNGDNGDSSSHQGDSSHDH